MKLNSIHYLPILFVLCFLSSCKGSEISGSPEGEITCPQIFETTTFDIPNGLGVYSSRDPNFVSNNYQTSDTIADACSGLPSEFLANLNQIGDTLTLSSGISSLVGYWNESLKSFVIEDTDQKLCLMQFLKGTILQQDGSYSCFQQATYLCANKSDSSQCQTNYKFSQ